MYIHYFDVILMGVCHHSDKIDNGQAFAWQSQLRVRWDDREKQCHINICDAHFVYGYEYLGNGPRLVITPLTDRICTSTPPQPPSLSSTLAVSPACLVWFFSFFYFFF